MTRYGTYSVVSVVDDEAPIAAPGQFHMLSTEIGWGGGDRGRPWLPRAISFLSNDARGRFDFLIDAVGPGTGALTSIKAGDRMLVTGPFGNGFSEPGEGVRPILLGGGIGAAPVMAAAESLTKSGVDSVLALGFRSSEQSGIAVLADNAKIYTDDGSAGSKGSVLNALEDETSEIEIFACGPAPMLEAVRVFAEQKGINCQLALEAPMACGFGACFGCAIHTRDGIKRLCVDGPVVPGSDLEFVSATGRAPS